MDPHTTPAAMATLSLRARPTSDRRDQILPLAPPLLCLVAGGGLQRGSVVTVGNEGAQGATTLTFALLGAASKQGSWCAAVGVVDPGILALAELGVDLDHLVLVPGAGERWADAVAFLLDGVDIVLVCPPGPVRPGVARRLVARTRQRSAVLVVLVRRWPWPEGPDLRLAITAGRWEGVGQGFGHLQRRHVVIETSGRRAATRSRQVQMWLPDGSGMAAEAEEAAEEPARGPAARHLVP